MTHDLLVNCVFAAGIGQLLLCLASLAIPGVLDWRGELAAVSPLIRRLFWTYAAYILATNLAFGLLSALAPASLLDGSPLAAAVSGFMSIYWGGRLIIQFALFHRVAPSGRSFILAEAALALLFALLTSTYAAAGGANLVALI